MFTKLTKIKHYTDIICIGVTVESTPSPANKENFSENIHSFHTTHLRPNNGRLHQIGEILTWNCDDIFDCITNYIPTRSNVLVVCNHSLVVLGSSDFTKKLEQKDIILHRGDVSERQISGQHGEVYDTQSFVVSCPPTIVMFSSAGNGNSYTMVDVANYGVKYLNDIYDNLSIEEKELIHNDSELGLSIDNSLTCCTLIARYIQEVYNVQFDNKLGGMGLTYSNMGMRCFRSKFYDDNILTHTNEDARILEDACYLGGRIEARYHGHYDKKCYLIDLQSLYPHLGRIKKYPTKLHSTSINPSEKDIEYWIDNGIVFASCNIETNNPSYPVRRGGNLRFPVGQFNADLCAEEFSEAYKSGCVRKIYKANFYESDYILKDYSQYMLDIRSCYKKSKNKLGELVTKLITNGLWGKFGQYGNLWQIMENEIADRQYGGYHKYNKAMCQDEQYRIIDWEVSKLIHAPYVDNTFRPISAAINSYSRHYILRHMLQAGLHNILYVCVDGLIITQEGLDRLAWLIAPTPHQYGMYKISESGNDCTILGHGMYQIGNKIAYVGLPKYDVKQFRGFWSSLRDTRLGKDIPMDYIQPVQSHYRYKDDRAGIFESAKYPGGFIAQDILNEPILPDISQCHHMIQPYFHVPEWS